jgi:hypothetical protein
MFLNVKSNTIGGNGGAEKGDLSTHNTHRSQFAREIFHLTQTVDNHHSLPSVETKREPSGTFNHK